MGRPPVVRVEGARQLRSALKAAGDDLADLRDANAQAARVVSTAATTDAPRLTGALAASIRPGATKTQAVVRAGGARVPYAAPIHWGWAARHIKPHPFALDAAVRTTPTWLDVYASAIDHLLARIERQAHP